MLKPEVGAGKLDVLGAWGSPGDGRAGLSTGIWGVDGRAGLSTGILEVDGRARLSTGIWGGWTVGQGCPQAPLQVM